jgi:hypothetical protein
MRAFGNHLHTLLPLRTLCVALYDTTPTALYTTSARQYSLDSTPFPALACTIMLDDESRKCVAAWALLISSQRYTPLFAKVWVWTETFFSFFVCYISLQFRLTSGVTKGVRYGTNEMGSSFIIFWSFPLQLAGVMLGYPRSTTHSFYLLLLRR